MNGLAVEPVDMPAKASFSAAALRVGGTSRREYGRGRPKKPPPMIPARDLFVPLRRTVGRAIFGFVSRCLPTRTQIQHF